MKAGIPYYYDRIPIDVPDHRIKAILTTQPYTTDGLSELQIVEDALRHPIGSGRLADLAVDKKHILIITSDHTRPVPSRVTMPLILKEIRINNPDTEIKILIATGFHRGTTEAELREKFNDAILMSESIVIHNAFNNEEMVSKGTLPSGGELKVNCLVDWADLIVAEGFIEPHFFAGFSGGRKSILPGICSNDTIMYNHNAQFIAHPNARTGVLEENPLHIDMLYAVEKVGLSFILNVVIDADKKVVKAFAGHPVEAHLAGCREVQKHAGVPAIKSHLVVASNGGYPLDQNIYQTVKGLTAAERCLNPGGVIIMISSCIDGHGGEGFYRWFADAGSPMEVARRISEIPRTETTPDQWEAQILARVLTKCRAVIIVSSHVDPGIIENMYMRHAGTFDEALKMADELLAGESEPVRKSEMVIIPDGIGVIIEES